MNEKNKVCGVEGCKRAYRAKGYCDFHFTKWKKGELPHSRYKTCVQEGCRKKRLESGLCEEHHAAKHGKKEEAAPAAAVAPAATPTPAPESPASPA